MQVIKLLSFITSSGLCNWAHKGQCTLSTMQQNFDVPLYALTSIKACVVWLYKSGIYFVSKSFAADEGLA